MVLFVLGLLGILSTDIPIPDETTETSLKELTPQQIQAIAKIESSIMLTIAIAIGVLLHKKVDLHVPIIEGTLNMEKRWSLREILWCGLLGGIATGSLSILIGVIFYPYIANALVELGENFRPSLATRFLYGGFTEEIMFRFGFMTLVVWLTSKIAKSGSVNIHWVGIIVTSTVFALAHLPSVFLAVSDPSIGLVTYYLIGTFAGGLVFGWLYWKTGLESAFVAHIVSHVIIVLGELFIG